MKLIEISEIPQMDVGAPSPTIIADDTNLYLTYYILNKDLTDRNNKSIMTIKFRSFAKFAFGSPSAETISGYPYYKLGLQAYSVFEVEQSELIENLRIINSVHPYHDGRRFDKLKHYIFIFHDRTFECVAVSYDFEIKPSSLKDECALIVDEIFAA